MVTFITGFLERFPELKGRPVYLAAESYGGHYVPAIAAKLVANEQSGAQGTVPTLSGIAARQGAVK